ncbi:unnamed protein product [Vitrella brassicaformis CCMP3155]|uniref:Uncharacterized protein n=1 Tax=Vitrella brassicaformis (strain CCMP3155) TaxID=1169540 RepID=A0A0G4F704_VITBC|nr:unnamed protein product [Vitrella brassicaformis CCMP3155]|eukprot:CEM07901.1 unnamed protein product [Vitrella brassicaformis CCMP3155]
MPAHTSKRRACQVPTSACVVVVVFKVRIERWPHGRPSRQKNTRLASNGDFLTPVVTPTRLSDPGRRF